MSPKSRLHQDKNLAHAIGQFVAQDKIQQVLDWALLEMQHQCARSDGDACALRWKEAGALEFCEILLNLGREPEIAKRQLTTQLNHDA